MKRVIKPIALGWIISTSLHALAAPQDSPAGLAPVLPGETRCNLSVNTPVIDYGTQSRWQLQDAAASQGVTPGKRTLMVSVTCPTDRTIKLAMHGERSASGKLRYGNRGSVDLHVVDAQLDGQDVPLAAITSAGVLVGAPVSSMRLQPGNSFGPALNGKLAKGKNFSVRIELEPVLPESAARIHSREVNESSMTVELID